jgi:FkbM family methyltransferase
MITVEYAGKATHFDDSGVNLERPGSIVAPLLRGKFYEARFLEYIRSLRIRGVYVDAGACWGTHTLFFAMHCPARHVHAFEPRPLVHDRLRRNIALNGVGDRVTAYAWALGERTGEVTVRLDRVTHRLATRRLDDIVKGPVSLIKIDVEGMEPDVLNGSARILRRWRPVVFAEARDQDALDRLSSCMARHRYTPSGRVFNATPTYEFVPEPSRLFALPWLRVVPEPTRGSVLGRHLPVPSRRSLLPAVAARVPRPVKRAVRKSIAVGRGRDGVTPPTGR